MNAVIQTTLQSVVHRHHQGSRVGPSTAHRMLLSRSRGRSMFPASTLVKMSESGDQPEDGQEKQEAVQKSGGLAKGQGTAIVTGVISIIFGIAYLALVQVMDMRGGELQPPPPEAFMQ